MQILVSSQTLKSFKNATIYMYTTIVLNIRKRPKPIHQTGPTAL